MNLIDRIRNVFRREPPAAPTLRNRRGGLAWIKPYGREFGADALAGRMVTTRYLVGPTMWRIEPPQPFTLTAEMVIEGLPVAAGSSVYAIGITDDMLVPIPEISDDERTQERDMQPPVPVKQGETV